MNNKKRVANQFLIIALIFYIAAVFFLDTHPAFYYLKAFSEAAIVGGIADWFAVTALFKHPFGIKIPHTAIIPNSKSKIGKNLSKFIRENFLSEEYVRSNLLKLDLKYKLIKALKENKEKILKRFNKTAKLTIEKYDYNDLIYFFKPVINKKIDSLDIKKVFIKLLNTIQKEGYHHKSFMMILNTTNKWLSNPYNEHLINEAIKNIIVKNEKGESSFSGKIKSYFIGEPTLHKYLTDFIKSVENDKNNTILNKVDIILQEIYIEIENNEEFKIKLNELKKSIIKEINVEQQLKEIFNDLKNWIIIGLNENNSEIKNKINFIYDSIINEIETNTTFDKFIKKQIEVKIPQMMTNNIDFIDSYFVEYIENLDTKEMSSIIEDKVGEDLQFIRINGTIIGGFIGLTLYFITDVITTIIGK